MGPRPCPQVWIRAIVAHSEAAFDPVRSGRRTSGTSPTATPPMKISTPAPPASRARSTCCAAAAMPRRPSTSPRPRSGRSGRGARRPTIRNGMTFLRRSSGSAPPGRDATRSSSRAASRRAPSWPTLFARVRENVDNEATRSCGAHPERCSPRGACSTGQVRSAGADAWRESAEALWARARTASGRSASTARSSAASARPTALVGNVFVLAHGGLLARTGRAARARDRRAPRPAGGTEDGLANWPRRARRRAQPAPPVVPRRTRHRHLARRARYLRRGALLAGARAHLAGRPARHGEGRALPRHRRQRLRVPQGSSSARATSSGSTARAASRCTRSRRSSAAAPGATRS